MARGGCCAAFARIWRFAQWFGTCHRVFDESAVHILHAGEPNPADPVEAQTSKLNSSPCGGARLTSVVGCHNPVLPVGQVISYIQGMSIDKIAVEAL
jgi:hypothetical protein